MSRKKIFILDVLPIIYRAHFAMINQSLYNSAGLNTSPILGFCNYLFQIIFKENPTHIAAAFDNPSIERNSAMKGYKATREKTPEEISVAIEYVRKIILALNIKKVELKGFEADDVIGTIAFKAAAADFDAYIVSPDKDLAQMVDKHIFLYRPPYQGTNFEILDPDGVENKYGVPPAQIADFLALKGDPADNIPGVPKIGEKTAVELLKSYGTVEAVLEHKEEISKASIRETLHSNEELALLSKRTATINFRLPLKFVPDEFLLREPDFDKLDNLLDELEFRKLKERIYSSTFYRQFEKKPVAAPEGLKYPEFSAPEIIMDEQKLDSLIVNLKEFAFQFYTVDRKLFLCFIVKNKTYIYPVTNKLPEQFLSVFADDKTSKKTYDSKLLYRYSLDYKFKINGEVDDIMLAHYILNPEGSHQADIIINQFYPGIQLPEKVAERRAAETSVFAGLAKTLKQELEKSDLVKVYKNIELPLASVLATMESNGIGIDLNILKEIADLLNKRIADIEKKIHTIAGEEINVRSSKQMAAIFEKLVQTGTNKKTKGGQFSTAEINLKELAQEHEIASLLLSFRKLDKVVSTYALSLPKFIDKKTGRIHADFKQAVTATGRLSCANPNLQNLPIGTEEGREIRKAVVCGSDNYVILSADYSQIELRLLAALSKDEALQKAFREKKDIHTITAARVFKVSEHEVSEAMRSKAKMVNYGIAYGISPYGLGQNLRIKQAEAKEIIDSYFAGFPSIKNFIDECINNAKKNGFTQTFLGRRRFLQEINSRNGTVRKMAERIAINAPIQGLAADLIKIAMIEIQKLIESKKLKSRMIMQIHDELVFEIEKSEISEMTEIVKDKMQHCLDLGVPLDVNVAIGKNWLELEDIID